MKGYATLAAARPLSMSPEPSMKSNDSLSSQLPSPARLNTRCLQQIFSHLSRSDQCHVALTCRAWSTPALELLWSHFKFVRERDFDRVFAIASRRNTSRPYASYIKSLHLVHADREFPVTPNIIFLITHLCSNLESIALTFHHTRPVAPPVLHHRSVLPPIARPGEPQPRPPHHVRPPVPRPTHHHSDSTNHFPSPPHAQAPQALQVPQAPQTPPQRPPQPFSHALPLAHFGLNCRKLRSVKLTSYTPKTDDSVYEMAKYMQSGSLESITFSGCATLQGSTLCKLAMTNPQLRHIEILGNTPVSDSSLATLAERCGPNLETLTIGNAHHLTDVSVRHLARRCKHLKRICLSNNADGNRLSEAAFLELIRRCTQLELFTLSNARCLGTDFFNSMADLVENALERIERGEASPESGLQRVCLGGVRREAVQSQAMVRLIHQSASHNDPMDDDEDDDGDDPEDDPEDDQKMRSMYRRWPKTVIIRGSSVWWQRRRVRQLKN